MAPAGAAVVLDPRDGSVLALASNPTYDPALFINGIKPDAFKALQDPAGHYPLNDRALTGLYSPGSTFKLATAIAALRKGLIAGNTTFNDTGSFTVGNRTFKNAGGNRYGRVNVTRALTVSSDVFFYTLGANFWEQRSAFGQTAIRTRPVSSVSARPRGSTFRARPAAASLTPIPGRSSTTITPRPSPTVVGSRATTSTWPSARARWP